MTWVTLGAARSGSSRLINVSATSSALDVSVLTPGVEAEPASRAAACSKANNPVVAIAIRTHILPNREMQQREVPRQQLNMMSIGIIKRLTPPSVNNDAWVALQIVTTTMQAIRRHQHTKQHAMSKHAEA